jgi:hypothetical protein
MSDNYSVSIAEITDLALRYIDEDEISEIPDADDLFCFFQRELPENKILKESEGWHFGGYGICKFYEIDATEKPAGKWIIFHFTSLASFPPQDSEIRLQPPHIARGNFVSPDKKFETKIVKISDEEKNDSTNNEKETEFLSFPKGRA